jgi:hypothetical protein
MVVQQVDLVGQQFDGAAIAMPGYRSCMRLKQRRYVDLPQPLGPIKAVTLFS